MPGAVISCDLFGVSLIHGDLNSRNKNSPCFSDLPTTGFIYLGYVWKTKAKRRIKISHAKR